MRILVDGSPLLRPMDGIGRYARELLQAYIEQFPNDHLTIIGFKDQAEAERPIKGRRVSYIFLPWRRRTYMAVAKLLRPAYVNRWLDRSDYDAVLYLNFTALPYIKGLPGLVMVHDAAHLDFPETMERKNLKYFKRLIPWSLRRGYHLATISGFAAGRLVQHYHKDPSEITILPPAIPARYQPASPRAIKETRQALGLPPHYLLFIGTLQPRKNILGILAAYSMLPEATRRDYPLVLAGAPGWNSEKIVERIEDLRRRGNTIITTGYFDDRYQVGLHSGATLFLFPTLYEGFGIPVLEAMACGVPVVTSRATVMEEVAGGAAALVEPRNPVEIAHTTRELLHDESARQALVRKGFKRVQYYSWAKSATKLNAALTKLTEHDL